MSNSFDAAELLHYLRQRRTFLGTVLVASLAVALIGSLVVPEQFTAVASIVIEPPGGSDPRTATAVSPMYLESLKTYEQFALSDTLFVRACEKFGLLENKGAPSIESFKQKVLRVTKLKETKILQISVTLHDPKQAQALVQYLAEETVNLSRALSRQGDQDNLDVARQQLELAHSDLERASREAEAAAQRNLELSLESQVASLSEVNSGLRSRLAYARANAAEATTAEIRALEAERALVEKELEAKGGALAQATLRRQNADARIRAAQFAFEAASGHLRELAASSGMRGEQLRIIDPGIVPQRPSFPNIPLNCLAALLIGGVGALSWMGFRFGLERRHSLSARPSFEVARGGIR
jgi:capsular polysaccharide biosynthesis protein